VVIRQSDTIAELSKALVAAQSEMEGVPRSTRGQVGNQERYYADLATVIDVVRTPLAKNKLAYVQFPHDADNGKVAVTTRIIHESGEWIESSVSMPSGGSGAQGIGSAITYARRYSLMAALGLAAEDDDGAAASTPAPKPRQQRAQQRQQPESQGPAPDEAVPDGAGITAGQIKAMGAAFTAAGVRDRDNRLEFIGRTVGRPIESSKDLTRTEASTVLDAIKEMEAA